MKKTEKNGFWFVYLGVFISGALLGYLKYFYQPDLQNIYAVVSHPLQIYAHKGHLLLAMLWMLLLGFIFASHVLPKLRSKQSKAKKSGWLNIVLLLYVSFSGYLIQVILQADVLTFAQWSHFIVGCLSIVPVLAHYLSGKSSP